MGKYFLIGVQDCGKTTLGKLAANILKLPFFDTDVMACNQLDFTNDVKIFTSDFARSFFDAQLSAIIKLTKLDGDAIISTGAEVSLVPECVKHMQNAGTIIHIKRNPELILENLKNKKTREIIFLDAKTGTKIGTQTDAVKLYMEEYPKYEAIANLSMENNGSEDKGVKKLVKLINKCQAENNCT